MSSNRKTSIVWKEGDTALFECKVIFVDPEGDIEIAGLDWDGEGFSALVSPDQLRPLVEEDDD